MYLFNATTCCKILVLLGLFLWTCHAEQQDTGSSRALPAAASTVKISATNGFTVTALKDGLSKRNAKVNDNVGASSVAPKSYDPPPEFYRGSGATSGASSTITSVTSAPLHIRDSATASFVSKPIAFPDTNARHKYPADSSQQLAHSYNSWQLLRGPAASSNTGAASIQDRISVKNYGSPESHGLTAGYSNSDAGSYGGYDSRPYASTGHFADYGHNVAGGGHYPVAGAYPSTGPGGYYAPGGGGGSAEGIPFDVYGGAKGQYAGAGGEYPYIYPDAHEPPAHKGHPELSQKALLAKSFLIPLASAAVLGIAAALVSNPLLLQLGTVAGSIGPTVVGKRRRRRRDLSARAEEAHKDEGDTAIRRLDANALAYRAHQKRSTGV